jgi:hypothetical protein
MDAAAKVDFITFLEERNAEFASAISSLERGTTHSWSDFTDVSSEQADRLRKMISENDALIAKLKSDV